jgi:DNA-binding NarL/FixJ family response regulator
VIKVLIVDDNHIVRDTLKMIISQDNEIEVVGLAANGKEAGEMCDRLLPSLVLMDIQMPLCNGVGATKVIKESHPAIKILILTTFSDREYVAAAINNGADGYILKDVKETELIRIIKNTMSGYKIVQDSIFEGIKKQYISTAEPEPKCDKRLEVNLTGREQEIIQLIVDGRSNKEIASELDIAEGTVRNMISNLLSKLQLQDRTQVAVFAIKNNLV